MGARLSGPGKEEQVLEAELGVLSLKGNWNLELHKRTPVIT